MLNSDECAALQARVLDLERLVMSLAEKLATVSEHLGRLAEKREARNG